MPITWQNINAPDNSGAMRGLAAAGDSFSGAFDKLGALLKGASDAQQFQVEKTDDANVLALKEALGRARTPEEVAALQGQMGSMRAGLTNKGRTAVLGAEDARTAALHQQILAANQFNDAQALNANQAVIGQYKALHAQGRGAEAEALIAPYSDKIPGFGDMAIQAITADQHTQKFKDDLLTSGVKRTTDISGAAATTLNAASNAISAQTGIANANTSARGVEGQLLTHLTAAHAANAEKMGNISKATIGSNEGVKVLEASIAVVAGDNAPVVNRLSAAALASNPAYGGLPTSVVDNIVKAHSADFGTWSKNPFDGRVVSKLKEELDAALLNPAIQAQMEGSKNARETLVRQMSGQAAVIDAAQGALFPEVQKQIAATLAAKLANASAPGVAGAPMTTADAAAAIRGPSAPFVDAPAANVPKQSPQEAKAADMLVRQVALEKDERAAGMRKDFTQEVKSYISTQDAAAQAKVDTANTDYRARQAESLTRASALAKSSAFGSSGTNDLQVKDTQRRRAEFEKELAASKKAK